MNTSLGCILLSRSIVHSEIFKKPPLYVKLWIYLLTRAQHCDYNELKRGQLFTSVPELIEACSWYVGARKVNPTEKQIRGVLDWLRKSDERVSETSSNGSMIGTSKGTHGIVVNIENYWAYQDMENYEGRAEGRAEKLSKGVRRAEQGRNINKNVNKNDKNDKNVINKIHYTELVSLLPKEYETMLETYGEGKTKEIIDLLHNYKLSNGKTYKSDYGAINSWVLKRWEDDNEKPGKRDERHTPKNRTVQRPKQSGWINKPDELPLPDLP